MNLQYDKSKEISQKEYFSGSNVHVYFGNVWVDQIASIEFSLQEQVTPIFGFHSYTFDRISRGQRLVSGNFRIHFTENGYLETILEKVASEMDRYENESQVSKEKARNEMKKYSRDQLIDNVLNTKSYDDYIEDLKLSFWGSGGDTNIVQSGIQKEVNPFYYTPRNGKDSILLEHGFNILIDFNPEANYGDFERCLNRINKDGNSIHQTYVSIIGAHLTGQQQSIANNAEVLQVEYGFLARDLNGDVSELSLSDNYRYDFLSV